MSSFEHFNCLISTNESLLNKYKIPILHLEFDYISNTTDSNELEQIIDILRSGQEGYYPDLLRAAENRLKELCPNSSRFIIQQNSKGYLDKDDLALEEEELKDIQNWISNVNKYSKELSEEKYIKTTRCDIKIRQYRPCQQQQQRQILASHRIPSTDYQSWEKYDPDIELLKMDLNEECQRNEMQKAKAVAAAEKSTDNDNKCKKETAETIYISERELEKGMEFLKANNHEFALQCFTRSIENKMNKNNLTNRALTLLKLKRYEDALNDCNQIICLDKININAHILKAEALEGLQRYEEALKCIEFAINKEPNNGQHIDYQKLLNRLRKRCGGNLLRSTRMTIIEN